MLQKVTMVGDGMAHKKPTPVRQFVLSKEEEN